MSIKTIALAISFAPLIAGPALADACDYRPSNLIGGAGASGVATVATGTAAAGAAAQAAGFYTLTHAASGLTMLASTAGGASAAGTVGIMGGTGGLIGTAASIILAPVVIVSGAIVGVGVAAYEGVCFFTVEKVNDPEALKVLVDNIVDNSDPRKLKLSIQDGENYLMIASKHDDDGNPIKWKNYSVSKLYVEGGNLRHSDFGPNSNLGTVNWYESIKSE